MSHLESLAEAIIRAVLPHDALIQYQSGAIGHEHLQRFCPTIKELSECYVAHEPVISSEDTVTAAYALYYLPINAAKFHSLAPILFGAAEKPKDHYVLDFGSGPATATLALAPFLGPRSSITLIDLSEKMLNLGKKLLRAHTPFEIQTAASLPPKKFSLILAGNVFAEMSESAAFRTAQDLAACLTPNGTIAFIEPALKPATQRLMRIRDHLINTTQLSPIFPCTHREPCPMLKNSPDDWCHGQLTWTPSRLTETLDLMTGFNKHRIKYSACVLRQAGPSVLPTYRVVTPPENDRRGTTLTLCGPHQFGLVTLPKRARTEQNLEFRRSDLWDEIVIEPALSGTQLGPEQRVVRKI